MVARGGQAAGEQFRAEQRKKQQEVCSEYGHQDGPSLIFLFTLGLKTSPEYEQFTEGTKGDFCV